MYKNLLIPIYKLVEAMRRVGQGELKTRISEDKRDEFGFIYAQFNMMTGKIDSLINEVYEEKIRRQQTQFKVLQAQINPHFLYNCLNFIYQMAMAENMDGAAKMALYLGRYWTIPG